MTLHDLFRDHSDKSILLRLKSLYEDANIDAFRKTLGEIRSLTPSDHDRPLAILVETVVDDGEAFTMTHGKCPEDGETYDLSFTPWDKWLGFDIDAASLEQFEKLDIICHSLWEMTFLGCTQEKIQKERDILDERLREVQEAIASGDTSKFKSWEEVKQELQKSVSNLTAAGE